MVQITKGFGDLYGMPEAVLASDLMWDRMLLHVCSYTPAAADHFLSVIGHVTADQLLDPVLSCLPGLAAQHHYHPLLIGLLHQHSHAPACCRSQSSFAHYDTVKLRH